MFMWGYQTSFRVFFEEAAKRLLERMGAELPVSATLIGVRRPGSEGLPVCIEPEKGPIKEPLFAGLLERTEEIRLTHPDRNMMFGDEPRTREHPENIRRDSIRRAIVERLDQYDRASNTASVVGYPAIVGKYDVFAILHFESTQWQRHMVLTKTNFKDRYHIFRSVVEAAIAELLSDTCEALEKKDPGRFFGTFERDLDDMLRSAAKQLMYVPSLAGDNFYGLHGLFDRCNGVSSLTYEGSSGAGHMVIARKDHPAIEVLVALKDPVPMREERWVRKLVQVASGGLALLSDSAEIYGLGRLTANYELGQEDAFVVRFSGHYRWELRHGETTLMRVAYGVPALPRPPLDEAIFKSKASQVLGGLSTSEAAALWRIVSLALDQRHGTMVVVTPNAESEADRLRKQSTAIQPIDLSDDQIRHVTAIDGALLVDKAGKCYAIGVILDGKASPKGTPSRGARYNSAIRYVDSSALPVFAVVISEDGTVDLLPALPPQIRKLEMESALMNAQQGVAQSDWDAILSALVWFDDHRFYLREAECEVANAVLAAYHRRPTEPTEASIVYNEFLPSAAMNDSYLLNEV